MVNDPSTYHVVYLPTRPDFVISSGASVQKGRCYSETVYTVESRRKLAQDDFTRLDVCHLLGIGQGYTLESTEEFTEAAPPVAVSKATGERLDVPPLAWNGELCTKPHEYVYYRYTVRRVCDSGD